MCKQGHRKRFADFARKQAGSGHCTTMTNIWQMIWHSMKKLGVGIAQRWQMIWQYTKASMGLCACLGSACLSRSRSFFTATWKLLLVASQCLAARVCVGERQVLKHKSSMLGAASTPNWPPTWSGKRWWNLCSQIGPTTLTHFWGRLELAEFWRRQEY